MRKIFKFTFTLVFIHLFLTFIILSPAHDIAKSAQGIETPFKAEIVPPFSDFPATYHFTFFPQKLHHLSFWVKIRFPAGTRFDPPLPDVRRDRDYRLKSILESMVLSNKDQSFEKWWICSGLPVIVFNEDETMDFRFNLPFEIDPEKASWEKLKITIHSIAGIVTPLMEGEVVFQLQSQAELDYKTSKPIMLYQEDFEPAELRIDNPFVTHYAAYTFQYANGTQELKPGQRIFLETSSLVNFPQALVTQKVLVNGVSPNYIEYHDGLFTIEIADLIHPYEEISLYFGEDFGITNPQTSGNIYFIIRHEDEPKAYLTNTIEIKMFGTYIRNILTYYNPNEEMIAYFLVSIHFSSRDLPIEDEEIALDLGLGEKPYKSTITASAYQSFILFDIPSTPGTYTFTFSWKDKTISKEYSIPESN